MTFFKNAWSKVTGFFQWIGVANKAQTLVNTFPGIENQEKLRLWIIENAENFQPVVARTATKIDDMILDAVKRIALNPKAFAAVFNLMQLAYEWVPNSALDPVFGTDGLDCFAEFKEAMDDGEAVQNPLLFISVVGLLINIVMFIRTQKTVPNEPVPVAG